MQATAQKFNLDASLWGRYRTEYSATHRATAQMGRNEPLRTTYTWDYNNRKRGYFNSNLKRNKVLLAHRQ